MKQVLQDLRRGHTRAVDVPSVSVARGTVLIRTNRSLVSAGTERMLVDFGRANPIDKARKQPDKVRMVLDKIRTDGLAPTIEAVLNKLDQPLPLGYCNVGQVVSVGHLVSGFSIGDRVASNGKHAEVVAVAANLCARVPACVSDDEAAFTVLGAVALQGMRLAKPTLGEAFVVTGLGLLGLITVQLLRANGCRVLGIDYDRAKLDLARQFGADVVDLDAGEDPLVAATAFSRGRGIDGILITAATQSNEPVQQAARMSRKRGRIILVGVTGLELSRADFFEKELTFQVSCSYGPGRYDPNYEEKGQDYPIGFVRWTEQRNFEAVLDMMAGGRLDVKPMISHRFPITDAEKAYDVVAGIEPSLGILLEYPTEQEKPGAELLNPTIVLQASEPTSGVPAVAFIGAGSYATSVLAPAFKFTGAQLRTIVSNSGVSAAHAARKFGFGAASTDVEAVLGDPLVDAVVIATRHNTHADLVCRALAAGKHVFVEKPLALSEDEVGGIERAAATAASCGRPPVVMVGFNRRFAPHIVKTRQLMQATKGPKALVMTINAGAIPAGHWTQDLEVGGGRIAGEACHFLDLLRFLVASPVTSHSAARMAAPLGDTVTVQLSFGDGSIGSIHYFANGTKRFPKERLEVFVAGRVLQLDNFVRLRAFDWPDFRAMNLWRQDKGQRACARAFVDALARGGPAPIPFDEILEVSRLTIAVARSLQ